MTEFGITALLVVLLIAVFVFFKKRKECSSCCSSKETAKSEPNAPEQVKQQPEIKSSDKPVVNVETTSVNAQITDVTVVSSPEPKSANKPTVNVEPSAKPQAKETAVMSPTENSSSSLPQDSILKRHYLTHLCTMIESIYPPRPTDSVLCRHYDAMFVTELDQCLNNKKAMEQLIHAYENTK
ncbi:MAG: hypothetical protein ACXWT1_00590 [Methylobacter sp.]